MNFPAFIFARGGSKGLPNKNLKDFGGKPLIVWAIEQALSTPEISTVIVSTDSIEIAKVAKDAGAEVPFMRPEQLATDDSPEWLSWRHAILKTELDKTSQPFISVPTTSPLRLREDISMCINEFQGDIVDAVIAVSESSRSPFFNMVKMEQDRRCELLLQGDGNFSRRQDFAQAFDITTICYVVSPTFILEKNHLFEGLVKGVIVPRIRGIDIDTQEDLDLALAIARWEGRI